MPHIHRKHPHLLRWCTWLMLLFMVACSQTSTLQEPPPRATETRRDERSVDLSQLVLESPVDIDLELLSALQRDPSTPFAIYFEDEADISVAQTMDWESRGRYVYETLRRAADTTQADVRKYLDTQGVPYESFWIANVVVVERSNLEVVASLLRAFPEVQALRAEPEIFLFQPVEAEPDEISSAAVVSNLARVNAPAVWELGVRGQGITVATIDSGVRYTHAALVNQYRGNVGGVFDHNYNWWDPYFPPSAPNDSDNHGTHVTGTMVGDDGNGNQIGMAPEAAWIACQGFTPIATLAGLLGCAQFFAAPTDLRGQNPDPDRRPHIVNNSWGSCGPEYDPWFQGVVNAWHAAGIYPVFANGNSQNCGFAQPPGLNTVSNPARYGNVTGVGSTGNNNGEYAAHSNWGPTDNLDPFETVFQNIKPLVVAPGVAVSSSFANNDNAYALLTGTSMSSPHVSGLIALMWNAAPCIVGDYVTTKRLIAETATPIPYATHNGDEGPGNVPNHATGWGEIDALAAVETAQSLCGLSGVLEGIVTSSLTATPLDDVILTFRADEVTRSTMTTADGSYRRSLPSGTYTVTALRYAYLPMTVSGVTITEGVTTSLDIVLEPAPTYTVSGNIRDILTGSALDATISISGPVNQVVSTTTPTGFYSVELVEGSSYTFTVNTLVPGYQASHRAVGPLDSPRIEDFALEADLRLCVAPGYTKTYEYYSDFGSSNGGYTVGGTNSSWAWGVPSSGPGAAFLGTNVWATNLSGNYSNNERSSLTSPLIDLSAFAGQVPVIEWWQWLHSEPEFDFVRVEASKDGGSTWNTVYGPTSGSVASTWTRSSAVLDSSYAVSNFRLRFRFDSDPIGSFPGWYLNGVGIGILEAVPPLLYETFEDSTFPPSGWRQRDIDGDGTQWLRSSTRAFRGVASAEHPFGSFDSGDQDGWLIMPSLSLPAAATYLSFHEWVDSVAFYDRHSLWICTGYCDAVPDNWTELAVFDNPVAGWREHIIGLAAYANGTVQLAFRYRGDYAAEWFIDAVTLSTQAPTVPCELPSSASIHWTAVEPVTVNATPGAETVVMALSAEVGSASSEILLDALEFALEAIEASSSQFSVVRSMQLYRDNNGDAQLDDGDTLLSTSSGLNADGALSFSLAPPFVINAGERVHFLVTFVFEGN